MLLWLGNEETLPPTRLANAPSYGQSELTPWPATKGESMQRDGFGLVFGAVFFLVGAGLLNEGISGRDPVQAETIAGAAILSLGALTLGLVLKDWLKWKSELKKYRQG